MNLLFLVAAALSISAAPLLVEDDVDGDLPTPDPCFPAIVPCKWMWCEDSFFDSIYSAFIDPYFREMPAVEPVYMEEYNGPPPVTMPVPSGDMTAAPSSSASLTTAPPRFYYGLLMVVLLIVMVVNK